MSSSSSTRRMRRFLTAVDAGSFKTRDPIFCGPIEPRFGGESHVEMLRSGRRCFNLLLASTRVAERRGPKCLQMRCIGYASPAWRRASKLMGEAKKAHGVLGGGQLGYNYQFMPLFVAGLETEIQGEHARSWGVCKFSRVKIAFLGKGEPMQKLVWRVKLVADIGDEAAETEVEVARPDRERRVHCS